ncbi:MAG: peptidoglycan-binding domain-containing protein, partial [Cyanobacteriota bacterium]|nr:peptidoglycan-binding domain-containing protein [Cyanobacteriota bacterium]
KLCISLVLGVVTIGIVLAIPIAKVMAGYTQCRTINPESPDLKHCLRRGDSGPMVGSLVEDLRQAGYWSGASTNNFTLEVERAVRRFQSDYETIPGLSGSLAIPQRFNL